MKKEKKVLAFLFTECEYKNWGNPLDYNKKYVRSTFMFSDIFLTFLSIILSIIYENAIVFFFFFFFFFLRERVDTHLHDLTDII